MKLSRKLIVPLFLLFLLFREASLIFDFIYEYPVKLFFDKIDWDNSISYLFVIVGFLLIWIQCKWIKNSYVMSENQWLVYVFIISFYGLARYGEYWDLAVKYLDLSPVKWHWQSFFEQSSGWIYKMKLIDVLWLSIVHPLIAIFKFFFGETYNSVYLWVARIYEPISKKYKGCIAYFKKETPQNENAFFEEDIALKDSDKISQEVKDPENENSLSDEESQQYHELTKVLVPKLVKQKFQKAFSIGIIGPYGNGKSSLVNHLRYKFEDQLKPQRFEVIEFLPAYSHKPEQISTDFFTLLASQLKKYHGALNQSMLTYAAKLIELGVNGKKDIQGLLKPADWFAENKSASQAYLELKEIFTQIDIKTIVIIDDVDRLGKDEIFEVLRIIRNTANFPNTIFVVAYDKDYVIGEIGNDLKYLDKYFQYELFVPPHRSEDLLRSFSELVLSKETGVDIKKLKEVINIETLNKTLLDRFVLNYRDVKVLTNIYCTNLCLLTEEVDYIDLLHFTLMNRHFPKQVRYIYNNSDELFDPINSTKKKLEFKKRDFLKKPITVDSFITELKIEDDSQNNLFKRLFLLLFDIKDDTIPGDCLEPLTNYEKMNGATESAVKRPYSPNMEFSIRNVERIHIYFEILLRNDDISNKDFWDKMGTDDFKKYITEFLSPLPGLKRKGLEKRIEKKLKDNDEKINSKTKIKNAIWACHQVNHSRNESNLIDVLSRNIIVNYSNALADIFGGDNDAFADFFNTNLWENTEISLAYKIGTILKLSKDVEAISSNDVPRYEGKPLYFGSSKEQIKEILISKTKEYIRKGKFKYGSDFTCISNVLDSELGVSDADIGFSDYLYNNKKLLFEYLDVVSQDYEEDFKFSSAIFKVFTDIDKFEKECFGLKEHQSLIREFHHLLELHTIRKGVANLTEFTPFHFNRMKQDVKRNKFSQSVYVNCKSKEGMPNCSFMDLQEAISTFQLTDYIFVIEGKHSYLDLMEKGLPNYNTSNILDYLKANKDDFEILSIQTPVYIDSSIILYSKYNKMIEELKQEETEPIH